MAWGNRITTTTQEKMLPSVVDTVLNSNVFATRMLSRAKKWKGEYLKQPITYKKGVAGGSFSGFDTFSTAASDVRANMTIYPKFYEIDVALPLDEISVNDVSETKVIDLMKMEMATRAQQMADEIGDLFWGDGTGNASKDFTGLGAIVDDGTSVDTYAGLSRATYTTIKATSTASAGTLSLAKMATLYSAIKSGSIKPTIGYCTEAVFNLYEQLLQPQERIAKDVSMMKDGKGMEAGTGFTGLYYKGFPILEDEKCPSGILAFINEKFLDWYALPMAMTQPVKFKSTDIEGNDYSNVMGLGFSWSDWIKPINSASLVGHIYLGGNLFCKNPKRNGKLTGITGI